MKPKRPSALTGTSGTYYVASRLAFHGLHAAVTFGNAPAVDVLVSRVDGAASVALQVKTTAWALRMRGRGQNKKPHHYEWDIGYKGAHTSRPDLFYALVDLKEFSDLPDVFVVPSAYVVKWFSQWAELKRYRFHPRIDEVEPFRNNWDSIQQKLEGK